LKLSTKGRYGLRALADLAINSNGSPVSVASIADRQHISGNYLESIFSTLKKAGIVRSTKGVNGGYALKESAELICIGDVLRILEGDMSIIDSDEIGHVPGTKSLRMYIEENVWNVVSTRIENVVNSTTLKDIIEN
jgi:Rrf2 family cysteine metabolism transcriptional repressor